MRKNRLIELLQAIPGNPEVVTWNGTVGDFMELKKPREYELVRMKEDKILEMIRLKDVRDGREPEVITHEEFLTRVRPNYSWEVPSEYIFRFNNEDLYEAKKVVMLEPKLRGKTDYGRGGDIDY